MTNSEMEEASQKRLSRFSKLEKACKIGGVLGVAGMVAGIGGVVISKDTNFPLYCLSWTIGSISFMTALSSGVIYLNAYLARRNSSQY